MTFKSGSWLNVTKRLPKTVPRCWTGDRESSPGKLWVELDKLLHENIWNVSVCSDKLGELFWFKCDNYFILWNVWNCLSECWRYSVGRISSLTVVRTLYGWSFQPELYQYSPFDQLPGIPHSNLEPTCVVCSHTCSCCNSFIGRQFTQCFKDCFTGDFFQLNIASTKVSSNVLVDGVQLSGRVIDVRCVWIYIISFLKRAGLGW